jgi:alkanesulfonate monooxygenase SsuD/methylene tetrahydromethanopterin reductase-like flavin-dependent oxidoreductase (luciferase family)
MVAVNVFAADTDAEGARLFSSLQQAFVNLRRGTPGLLPPPVDSIEGRWSPQEQAGLERALEYSAIGAPGTVADALQRIVALTAADELILTGQIFDHAARLRSFEIAASVRESLHPR